MGVVFFDLNHLLAKLTNSKGFALSPKMDIELVFIEKFIIYFPAKLTTVTCLMFIILFNWLELRLIIVGVDTLLWERVLLPNWLRVFLVIAKLFADVFNCVFSDILLLKNG